MRKSIATTVALLLAACSAPAKQYVLTISAKKPSEPRLCEREGDGKTRETCGPYTAAPLEAPGVASLVITDGQADDRYELVVKQELKSGTSSLAGFLDELIGRITSLSTAYLDSIKPRAGDADATDKAVLGRIVKELRATVPDMASQLQQRLNANVFFAAPDEPPPAPDRVFDQYIAKGGGAAFVPPPELIRQNPDGVLGEPDALPPPPRATTFGTEHFAFLKARGLNDEQVIGHILDWCTPASFGTFHGKSYAEALAEPALDEQRILTALGLTPGELTAFLAGSGTLDLAARPRERLHASAESSEDARTIQLLYDAAAIDRALALCEANLVAGSQALSAVTAPVKTRASAVKREIEAMRKLTAVAATSFETIVTPAVVASAVQVLEGKTADSDVTFGPFPVQQGETSLTVLKVDGEKRSEAFSATMNLPPRYGDRLSLSVGPVVIRRKRSLRVVTEEVQPEVADPPMATTRRIVVNDSDGFVDAAVALHVGLWKSDWFQAGALLGFPLSEPEGSRHNILLGVGLRHDIGLELGLGASVFMTQSLRDEYDEPIDLSAPSNMTLTADQVREDVLSHAFFVFIGISTDVLEKL